MASHHHQHDAMTASTASDSSTLSALAPGPTHTAFSSSAVAAAPVGNNQPNANSSSQSTTSDSSQAVMNDKVQALAGSIYEEFENMITRYDRDVVKNLMPLIVNVLENLDFAFTEAQELEVEVELLKEDNEQLVTQYEREKQLRKGADQKMLEMEDANEMERKEANVKVASLTSIVKMFELKAKNSQDHISRLEEKETEMKKEYSKLHERYTELFKTHIDYMERAKAIEQGVPIAGGQTMGSQLGQARPKIAGMALNQINRSSGPVSFGYSELEMAGSQPAASILSVDHSTTQTTPGVDKSNVSLSNELKTEETSTGDPQGEGEKTTKVLGGWVAGSIKSPEIESVEDLEVEEVEQFTQHKAELQSPSTPSAAMSKSQTKTETRTGNNLYQELSFQDSEALGDVDEGADITVSDNYFGMGKEVENLIAENNELLATKNALNIVKDDLIAKVDELTGEHEILREEIRSLKEVRVTLQQKIQELEQEVKRVKEEADVKANRANSSTEDTEDVPMAQRKRFTRVEMARVLMERNQYKERFMELQEAVRWTEMIRASRADSSSNGPSTAVEKKSGVSSGNRSIWKFFGSLFGAPERLGDPLAPYLNTKFGESSNDDASGSAPLPAMRAKSSAERRTTRNADVFDGDTLSTEKPNQRRLNERKEQYKQVRAHVKKEDGRIQAYGWSLPADKPTKNSDSQEATEESFAEHRPGGPVPVPVPVYCRPLMEKEPGMKIWCAAGVNLSGGRLPTANDPIATSADTEDDPVESLDKELSEGKRLVEAAEKEEELEKSSKVWICTSTHAISKVTVIDANSPADVLETFQVCSSHLLCIASVPGAKETDFRVDEELNKLIVEECEIKEQEALLEKKMNQKNGIDSQGDASDEAFGTISFITCGDNEDQEKDIEVSSRPKLTKETALEPGHVRQSLNRTMDVYDMQELCDDPDPHATLPFISHHTLNLSRDLDATSDSKSTEDVDAVHRRFAKDSDGQSSSQGTENAGCSPKKMSAQSVDEKEKMSSVLPTMWLGSQSGSIYVHSSVSHWKHCIHSIRLKDSVLSISHVKGRVMAALANGTIAIFHRDPADGEWDLKNYHLLDLGKPHHSIRCMIQVQNKIWCGYRNKIYVINPEMMKVETSFDAHPRKESQVRQMAWVGDGVWVSIRLDSTLRLYHAHTLDHLQDVDIEPYVSKMLGTGKLGFSFVRITALLISCNRLWMGTGNGVIISVPLSDGPKSASSSPEEKIKAVVESKEDIKVYANKHTDKLTMETFIPYCSMAHAQLSFHGHRDAVKFFVSVPGHGGIAPSAKVASALQSTEVSVTGSMLVMSGGEGYIDFRLGESESESETVAVEAGRAITRGEQSHLVVWQVPILKHQPLNMHS